MSVQTTNKEGFSTGLKHASNLGRAEVTVHTLSVQLIPSYTKKNKLVDKQKTPSYLFQ